MFTEAEYLELRRRIEETYQRELAALDTVWAIANRRDGEVPPLPVVGSVATKAVAKSAPATPKAVNLATASTDSLQGALRVVGSRMEGNFTLHEVTQRLQESIPRFRGVDSKKVSNAMSKLVGRGVFVYIQEKYGSQGAIYRRNDESAKEEIARREGAKRELFSATN